jgi:DNA-binding NarL/FixJ family response regulator
MIVDDHKLFREGIRKLLECDSELKVICEAYDGNECLDKMKIYKPDVILLDINMSELNGLGTITAINKKGKNRPKVLVLTSHYEIDYLFPAFKKGVGGYLLKDVDSVELIRAIHTVYNGGRYIQLKLLPALNSKLLVDNFDKIKVDGITKREMEVLKLIGLGKSNKEIASLLSITERTVKNHLVNIYEKIDCKDRTEAALFCVRNGIVSIHNF